MFINIDVNMNPIDIYKHSQCYLEELEFSQKLLEEKNPSKTGKQ